MYLEEKDSGGTKDTFRCISSGAEVVFFCKLHTVTSFSMQCSAAARLSTFSNIHRSMDNQCTRRDACQPHNTRHFFSKLLCHAISNSVYLVHFSFKLGKM